MAVVDSHAFSSFPVYVVLGVVILLVSGGMLARMRLVQLGWLGWLSLAAGLYFLCRCLNSYAVVDSWGETALILGAMVYYVAGLYAAQHKSHGQVVMVLCAALLLNLLVLWAARQPWFCLEWTGRATYTPEGRNSLPVSLFVYKNFAGVFFCLGGSALVAWSLWAWRGVQRWCGVLVGLASAGASFMCGTRAVFLVMPMAAVGLWLLWVFIRLFRGLRVGKWNSALAIGLAVAVCVFLADLFVGHHFADQIRSVDSHLRFKIWASLCEVIPLAPAWGCGANATTWEIIPYYCEWQLPNYAHNEYLQVWVDYGVIGVILVLFILVAHLVQGMRCLAAEPVSEYRQYLVAVCMLLLVGISAYAVVDFPWHSFALVSLCAFCCGALASPFAHRDTGMFSKRKWVKANLAPVVAVKAQSWRGRVLLLLLGAGLLFVCGRMGASLLPAWRAQWKYNDLSQGRSDSSALERRALIAELLPQYPSPALMDTYFMFPQNGVPPAERERLLRIAIAGNPKQLFTLVMLVDVLGSQNKHAEAERLMREHYVGESMPRTTLNNWPGYYAYNLITWGRYEMQLGHHATALSLLDYGLRLHQVMPVGFDPIWREGEQPWKQHGGVKPGLRQLMQAAATDLRLLRLTGVQPDHSWQRPMTPGGRASLYRPQVLQAR